MSTSLKHRGMALLWVFVSLSSLSCRPNNRAFIRVSARSVALTHVRVIDGTGAPARNDQTLIIDHGRIRELGDAALVEPKGVAETLDLSGYTVLPGLFGMHDPLFYALPTGSQYQGMPTFPRLYLAAGVTSVRTAGATHLNLEQQIQKRIEDGQELGPHLYLTGAASNPAAGEQEDPEAYAQIIQRLIRQGVNSVNVTTGVRYSELAAIIQTAHQRGIQVTGRLCTVGFREAADLGIDNLEHGLVADTEFYSDRRPDTCPEWTDVVAELTRLDISAPQVQITIRVLVNHHVAITSTLALLETFSGARAPLWDGRTMPLLAPEFQRAYLVRQAQVAETPDIMWRAMLNKEMEFEREFVRAGGLLTAGADPTGWGGVIAGYGDQHGLELLVQAGFTPEQAIRIATYNGALFLRQADRVGSLAAGKEADLLVVRGNPARDITDIRQMEIVFKDGVGYDSAAILRSLVGQVARQ